MYYLDNSATTRPYPEVVEAMAHNLCEGFGNPSSLHSLGFQSEQVLKRARKTIAASIGAKEREILFTSGGTEGNNLAILGYLNRNRHSGNHLMVSAVEHPSVLKVFQHLEEEGYRVSYIPVSAQGELDYGFVERELCDQTALLSVMRVNNEVGCLFDVPRLRRILEEKGSRALLHSDCVQAYGKMPLTVGELGADMVTLSAHKIHGPKGVGALYLREGVKLAPIVWGGGQEDGLRNGTENLPGIVGFAKAAELSAAGINQTYGRLGELKQCLIDGLKGLPKTEVNSPLDPQKAAPHIVNISFLGIRSEILLHSLEQLGVYVSSGSACASHDRKHRKVLEVMGYTRDRADSSVRISFGAATTLDEVQKAVRLIRGCVADLQKKLKL